MDYCQVNSDQKWEVTSDGFIQNVIGGRKCIAPKRAPSVGLWITNCQKWSDPSLELEYKFTMNSNGEIKSRIYYDSCIDVFGDPGTQNGAHIDMWDCENSSRTDEKWRLSSDGFLISQLSKKCIKVSDTFLPDESYPLVLWDCLPGVPGAKQIWKLTKDGFLKNTQTNLCTTMQTAMTPTGIRFRTLVAKVCPTETQRWTVMPGGQIKNRVTNQCIDMGKNSTGGRWWDLHLSNCDSMRAEQQWVSISV